MDYRELGGAVAKRAALAQSRRETPQAGSGLPVLAGAGTFVGGSMLPSALVPGMRRASTASGKLTPEVISGLRSVMKSRSPVFHAASMPAGQSAAIARVAGMGGGAAMLPATAAGLNFARRVLTPQQLEAMRAAGSSVFVGGAGANPAMLAHEIGHTSGWALPKSKWGARLYTGSRLGAMVSPLAALGLSAYTAKPEDTALRSAGKGGLTGGGLGLGLSAPMLFEEGRASLRGLRALKTLGLSPAARRAARGALLRAFGTYGATAVLPAAGIGILGALLGRWVKRRRLAKKQKATGQQ